MPENKKEAYNKAAFKTVFQFGQMHNIKKDNKKYLNKAADVLYKKRAVVKNPSGNLVPAIMRNSASHSGGSPFLVNPLAGGILLETYESVKKIETAKQAKGATK